MNAIDRKGNIFARARSPAGAGNIANSVNNEYWRFSGRQQTTGTLPFQPAGATGR